MSKPCPCCKDTGRVSEYVVNDAGHGYDRDAPCPLKCDAAIAHWPYLKRRRK